MVMAQPGRPAACGVRPELFARGAGPLDGRTQTQVDKRARAKYSPLMTYATPAANEPAVSLTARVEAARYALLRRLAPSMRHHLVVNLQPIGMVYEVMDRRLRAPQPDLASIHDSAHKINSFARAALSSSIDVVTWLAQEESATIPVGPGVRECVGMLATSLGFRGFAVRNEVADLPGEVRKAAMRNVLTSALIHCTDQNTPPAELTLKAGSQAQGLRLTLSLRSTEGSNGYTNEAAYRTLEWDDVQALAQAEQVQLERDGDTLQMTLPWAAPKSPR